MWLKKKRFELRVVIILLLIVAMISITGIISYKNLSSIAKRVSTTVTIADRNSIVLRQLLIDIQEAENDVRSYNLTSHTNYLSSFYSSMVSLENRFRDLEKIKVSNNREMVIMDSVILLTELRFELLKKQLYIDDESKITDELNEISTKIDEAYKKTDEASIANHITLKDTVIYKKESLFRKIFGKKRNKLRPVQQQSDTVSNQKNFNSENPMPPSQIRGVLKKTVLKVQNKQLVKLAERKNTELLLAKEGQLIVDRIRSFVKETEAFEKKEIFQKIEIANQDVNMVKILAIVISAIISLLLLIVSYFIVKYVGKKREYELALINAKQNAEDLAKTKEAFLANMSHEIKTPLNAIYGFTEQVLKTKLDKEQSEQLNIVKESADHLIRLISDILEYSKIQSGKIHVENNNFDLKKELENIHTLFIHQSSNKNLELIFQVDADVPDQINGNLTKLKQVMYNLISNAIKFTEIGSVTVIVKKIERNAMCFLSIQVSDTGIGIAEDKISKLFNEYEQLHTDIYNKFGGTGLGLVITKKILEHMGGSIEVKSKPNKGTEVTIQFPFTAFDSSLKSEISAVIPQQIIINKLKYLKVLIVDDEDFNRLLLKTILAKFDAIITEAVNGNEAIHLIKNNHYDIVLMDIRMPEKTGLEACIEIRKFKKELIILASTAIINKDKTEECVRAGFNGFVFKPFTEKDLLEKLCATLIQESGISSPSPKISNQTTKLNFNELSNVANGDEAFKKEMIAIFHASINTGLKNITELCVEEKWEQVAEIAHKILPSCKHFEATNLYNRLKYFEMLRDSPPSTSQLNIKLQELKIDIDEVNMELQVYL